MEDLEIYTHHNETLASVKRQIIQRLKGNPGNIKLELKYEGETIDTADDRKILLNLPLRDKALVEGKLIPVNNSGIPASSPDSSSDSSTSSPQHHYEGGPNPEVEQCLPGVIIGEYRSWNLVVSKKGFLESFRQCSIRIGLNMPYLKSWIDSYFLSREMGFLSQVTSLKNT